MSSIIDTLLFWILLGIIILIIIVLMLFYVIRKFRRHMKEQAVENGEYYQKVKRNRIMVPLATPVPIATAKPALAVPVPKIKEPGEEPPKPPE